MSNTALAIKKTGLQYDRVNNTNYVIDGVVDYNDLGICVTREEFEKVSTGIAKLYSDTTLSLNEDIIRNLSYPSSSVPYLQPLQGSCVAMRLGYVVDTHGQPKLIEVNSQTPSFWWECESGSDIVLSEHGQMRKINYFANLTNMLRDELVSLGGENKRVGLVTCNSQEDIFQMNFIAGLIKSLNINIDTEVLTIEQMDVNQRFQIFSRNSDTVLDILFFWYPLEWLDQDKFADGSDVSDAFYESLKRSNVKLFNGLESLIFQNKNYLAFISEFWPEIEKLKLDQWIAPTYYTLDDLQEDLGQTPYIGKPIFGRQGLGIFGHDEAGDFSVESDDYYLNQYYIYQPKYQTMPLIYNKEVYNYTYEQWVYRTSEGWKPGGSALRLTTGQVVDDNSQWLTIH